MGRVVLLAQVLLGLQLAASLIIDIPTSLEARGTLNKRAVDARDEVVYLTDCRKYKNKEVDEKDVVEHISFTLYHDTYDYTYNNASLRWQAIATPSYPKSQRIDSMGGAFVDWLAGKQYDRIEAKFDELEKGFWVHSLSSEGDPQNKVTGVASLGDHDMRCYREDKNINFTKGGWYYKCKANYYCTRKSRQIRRTLFSISPSKVDVEILGKRLKGGILDDRVEGVVSNVYYWLSTFAPEKGSVAKELVIDMEMKRQSGNKQSVRMDWKAGLISTDETYDPSRIKLISQQLQKILEPEVFKEVKFDRIAYWDSDYSIYKAPFPAKVTIMNQIAFQENQFDWKSTDEINIDIITYDSDLCGDGAAWAKFLAGLFSGAAALATGGASALLSGLGGIAGATGLVVC